MIRRFGTRAVWANVVRLTECSSSLATLSVQPRFATVADRWQVHTTSYATGRRLYSTATAEKQKACSSCSKVLPLNSLACSSCGTLQPLPSELDPYQLLGLDFGSIGGNGWDVNTDELKATWRKAMALSHPDRMGGKDEKQHQIAEQQSAMLNKAYETLREPLQRAHLLLERFASSVPSEAESLEDPDVLMSVMELREELEEAQTEEEAAQVRDRNRERLDAAVHDLREAFAKDPPDVEAARSAAVGLRYWANIDKAAREWAPGKRVELQH